MLEVANSSSFALEETLPGYFYNHLYTMSSFSFAAATPMSPHHRRAQSPIRDIYSPSTMHSPSRLVRRLSGSAAMTPPSTTKSHRKSSEAYSECDRFIPSRAASNLEDAFERMESNDPISRQENQGAIDLFNLHS